MRIFLSLFLIPFIVPNLFVLSASEKWALRPDSEYANSLQLCP